MDRIKRLLAIIFGSSLILDGKGRTYAKAPMWLVVLAALASFRLAILTALLAIAFGMRASVVAR